jgi:hypothetical protein
MNTKITTIVAVLVVLAFCSASESDLRCRISVLTFILAPTASAFLRPLGCIGVVFFKPQLEGRPECAQADDGEECKKMGHQ